MAELPTMAEPMPRNENNRLLLYFPSSFSITYVLLPSEVLVCVSFFVYVSAASFASELHHVLCMVTARLQPPLWANGRREGLLCLL